MKTILTFALLISIAACASAQITPPLINNAGTAGKRGTVNICTPNRNKLLNTLPLYVVYSHDKMVYRSDTAKVKTSILSELDREAIKSMNIVKDSTATQRFGTAGQWGVIEIYLDDVKKPEAYKAFVKEIK